MKNLILIVAGEPESINTELLSKLWIATNDKLRKKIVVIGNYLVIKDQLKKIRKKIPLNKIESINSKFNHKALNILNIKLKYKNPFYIKKNLNRDYVLSSINYAHNLCKNKLAKGFINCAIDKKKLFYEKNTGLTEYLASINGLKGEEVMLIYNKSLSVVPLTTHIRLKELFTKLDKNYIIKKIKILNKKYKKLFGFKPKICLLGVNPHNYENRINSEEIKIIKPAVKYLRSNKIKIDGPIPADTAFNKLNIRKYDVIVGIYHDQVLAPFKALFGYDAINITLGLPYLRISPDHGTGKDIIKKNMADPLSLINSVKFYFKAKN